MSHPPPQGGGSGLFQPSDTEEELAFPELKGKAKGTG